MPAETAHRLAFATLRWLYVIPGALWSMGARRPADPRLRVRALGLELPSPIGLAAGFDKDAEAYEALGALGFGFVEVGTLTAEAQPGNERPRLFRLPLDRALINRMGFNNQGARAAAARIRDARGVVLGVNIGKTKRVAEEDAVADYVASAEALATRADYFVVNVSSPNTPGLRNLQATEKLGPLLDAVRQTLDRASPAKRVPLLVKVAPDLSDTDLDAVADLALARGLDGIIATNTTIAREGLRTPEAEVAAIGAGGLSGAPLRARALAVLSRLRAKVGGELVLVAAGGIETGADVVERLEAGASLVQIYTGFIYGGPTTAVRLGRELGAILEARGLSSVSELGPRR